MRGAIKLRAKKGVKIDNTKGRGFGMVIQEIIIQKEHKLHVIIEYIAWLS